MNLMAIKLHMKQVKMATLGHLCQVFGAEPDYIRCLLTHWMHKGKIRLCMKRPACGSRCFKCPSTVTEIYEWVEGPTLA